MFQFSLYVSLTFLLFFNLPRSNHEVCQKCDQHTKFLFLTHFFLYSHTHTHTTQRDGREKNIKKFCGIIEPWFMRIFSTTTTTNAFTYTKEFLAAFYILSFSLCMVISNYFRYFSSLHDIYKTRALLYMCTHKNHQSHAFMLRWNVCMLQFTKTSFDLSRNSFHATEKKNK